MGRSDNTIVVDGKTVRLIVVEPWPYNTLNRRAYRVYVGHAREPLGIVIRPPAGRSKPGQGWKIDGDPELFTTRLAAVEYLVRGGR